MQDVGAAAAKSALRRRLRAARRQRSADALSVARAAICAAVMQRARAEGWACAACYEPLPTEPGSTQLLEGLAALGVRVLVPATLPDRDLDWRDWPHGPYLGVDAVALADAVLVPALAIARDGTRLGRGGGSYDRALVRCSDGARVAALLFDVEVVDALPAEPWDRPVHEVITPSGWTRVR